MAMIFSKGFVKVFYGWPVHLMIPNLPKSSWSIPKHGWKAKLAEHHAVIVITTDDAKMYNDCVTVSFVYKRIDIETPIRKQEMVTTKKTKSIDGDWRYQICFNKHHDEYRPELQKKM